MTNLELAKKALKRLGGEEFNLSITAYEGGACGNGWDGESELFLSKGEIAYLIQDQVTDKRVFEDIEMKELDLEAIIEEEAQEGAWLESPNAYVNDIIPKELKGLAEELEHLDPADKDSLCQIREKLKKVSGGDYTFSFTIKTDDYYFTEDGIERVPLTSEEALGLLYGEYDIKEAFEGICVEALGDDYIDEKAEEMDFAEGYIDYSYSGDCPELDTYLDSWSYLLNHILSGDIKEDELDKWLEYFDDAENYEYSIEEWYNDFVMDE